MSRQEDFEKAAEDYCEDHSHCIYFEAGAEYGYKYAVDKACEWLKMMDVNDYLKIVPGFGYVIEDEDAIKAFRRAMEE